MVIKHHIRYFLYFYAFYLCSGNNNRRVPPRVNYYFIRNIYYNPRRIGNSNVIERKR